MNRVDNTIERIRNEQAPVAHQREILDVFKRLLPVMTKGDVSDIAEVLERVIERQRLRKGGVE